MREFRPDDLEALTQIGSATAEASQWAAVSYLQLAATAGSLLLVGESSSGVIGFLAARYAVGEAEILNLAVSANARRSGIGSALVAAAIEEFQRQLVSVVFLEVRQSNVAAIGLYQKFGFAVSTRRKDYYSDPPEDCLVMMRKLILPTG